MVEARQSNSRQGNARQSNVRKGPGKTRHGMGKAKQRNRWGAKFLCIAPMPYRFYVCDEFLKHKNINLKLGIIHVYKLMCT